MPAPLSSLKILDFSTLLPGPFATMILADLGADVLRIESPTRLDLVRMQSPKVKGNSANHATINRSKKSIALNLKHPHAIEIVQKLVKEYDIVLEQFRPGVMKRLGINYEMLREYNPEIIFCSITGYGQTGPYRDRVGHDLNYLAFSGVSHYSRRKGESPVPFGIQIADLGGGSYHAVMGILAAVIHREKTGQGQAIDISMSDAMLSTNVFEGSNMLSGVDRAQPESTWLNGGSIYDYYKTKDGRWVSVSSLEPKFFAALLKAMDLPKTLLKTPLDDLEAQKGIKKILREKFLERNWPEWESIFDNIDACIELVLSLSEALEHEHFREREMFVEVPGLEGLSQKQIASPFKFSNCKLNYKHIGVGVGEQTDSELKKLGYNVEEIEKLKKEGVCIDNKTKN